MTNTEIKTVIRKVINTLNIVDVKGRENLNHLLGAILTLEDIENRFDEPKLVIEGVENAEDQTD